ncbi:hypothetical protein [Sneathiella glossodoripedis]|uniref:hypothetical protein n=1 Tax=Sneathiella glossodoripedis TaxID=418853 RepID=UPI00047239B8|nr:hypothetical protein [Sneathiella glossodoripedis]
MNRVLCIFNVLLVAVFVTVIGGGVKAQTSTEAPPQKSALPETVLIVQLDDGVKNSVSAELYKTVVARIADHLQAAGFETIRSSGKTTTGESDSQADQRLLQSLQNGALQQNGIAADFVAVVQILADMSLLNEGTEITVEIRGRMINVASRDILAKFDLSLPQTLVAPSDCDRNCIIGLLQANTEQIADGLGAVLGERLRAID